jgi:hypothetical protein
MKTPSRSAATRELKSETAKGENQEAAGRTELSPASSA